MAQSSSIHRGFASAADCREVIEAFLRLQPDEVSHSFWSGRVVYGHTFRAHEPGAADILQSWRRRSTALVEEMALVLLYADNVNVVRWPAGIAMPPHQDDRHPDGSEHPTPWREWAGVIYLNDDFEGGELYFPERPELNHRPVTGDFVFFPGDWRHGVCEARGGDRYTAPNWYTSDISREDKSW